jgi:hypothetical protein
VHEDVADLVAESGALVSITGAEASSGDRFSALAFQFAAGTLHLGCDADTDEIIVEVSDRHPGYPSIDHESLLGLVGMSLEYAWELTNHRGYTDAFQLRLVDARGREESRQFEGMAAAIDVYRVAP